MPLTMRRLWRMMEGRDRVLWSHTSAILAAVAGLFEKVNPDDFNPYMQRDRKLVAPPVDQKAGFAALKTLVLSGGFGGK